MAGGPYEFFSDLQDPEKLAEEEEQASGAVQPKAITDVDDEEDKLLEPYQANAAPESPEKQPPAAPAPLPPLASQQVAPGGAVKYTSPKLNPQEGNAELAQAGKLDEQEIAAKAQESQAKQDAIGVNVDAAKAKEDLAQQQQQEQQQILDEHQQRLNAALVRKDQAFDAFQKADYHDYWSDKTTGDRVLAAIAVGLGGVGGGENKAADIIQNRINTDFRRQELQVQKNFQIYQERGHDVEMLRQAKADQLSDLALKKSAAMDSIANHYESMLLAKGIPAEQAARDQNVIGIRRQALALREKVAQQTQAQVEYDTGRRVRSGRAGGGGGAGGGAFNPKIERANAQQMTEIDREKTKFQKETGLDVAGKAYTEVDATLKKLKASKDPATQIAALDSFIRANRGGSATAQAVRLQLGHLGGVGASLQGWLEGKETGQLGAQQIANLTKALEAAHAETGAQIGNIHKTFVDSFYTGARYQQKGNWEEKENELFGKFGFRARPDPNAPTIVPGSGRLAGGNRGVNARAGTTQEPAPSPTQVKAGHDHGISDRDIGRMLHNIYSNPNDPRNAAFKQALGMQ